MTDPSSNPPPPAQGDSLVGTTLGGRYAIERIVGRGGMGVVYLAQDRDDGGREVVLKVLARQLLDDTAAQQRFDREAASLKSLRHANIVEMYGFEREGARGYIVMEYLDGELLSTFLSREGPLPLASFVPIAAQVLKGAGYAHSREVVLRDIKPQNMMLCDRQGRARFVKMLDFGQAKLLSDGTQITQEVIGTTGYIAPEVIEGQSADLRADVYALGVMFYCMLAGRLPFPSEDHSQAALLYKTVNVDAPALGELIPEGREVSEELLTLIHDCLRKDPNDRPADANVVVERLIDAVPASLFRLPQSGAHPGASAAPNVRRERAPPEALSGPAPQPARPPTPESSALEGSSAPDLAGDSEYESESEDTPAQRSRGGLWIGLAAVVLLGAAVAGGLAMSSGGPKESPKGSADAAPATQTPAMQAPAVASSAAPRPVAPPADAPPDPVDVVGPLNVRSSPEGASVLVDDSVVGTTPFKGTASLGSHEVIVRAEGYEDWANTVVVSAEDGSAVGIEASLTRDGTGKPRRRTARRRNRHSTATDESSPSQTQPATKSEPLPSGAKESSRSEVLLTETQSGKKSGLLLPGSD